MRGIAYVAVALLACLTGCASLPSLEGRGDVLYDVEPGTSAGQRAWIQFLEGLAIEWLL